MSDSVKVGENSVCPACENTPVQDQCVECFMCQCVFHAYCEGRSNDTNLGTKTMVKTFLAGSTKSNFKFFCDSCLTQMEVNMVETENQKINGLEKKVNSIEYKLDEITKLLKKTEAVPKPAKPTVQSVWHDKEKLESIKAPPSKSLLIIKSSQDSNQNEVTRTNVEKAIMVNNIAVSQSYKNSVGDLVVVCDTEDKRNELKDLVASANQDIVMNTPVEKRASITIVGLQQEYNKDEIIQMLVLQNGFIKGFTNSNDIKKHIEIFAVRPLKNNPARFQVFASVSTILREGFLHFGNKVTLGLTSCKVYDRYHVKRCNNCQKFGHYMKDCPTPDSSICGKCASYHHCTKDCDDSEPRCINCVGNNIDNHQHHTNSFKCPSLLHQQQLVMKKQSNRLNWIVNPRIPPR